MLRKARTWWREMIEARLTATEFALSKEVSRSYVTRVIRLNFLAPSIVEMILAGEHPVSLDATTLLGLHDLSPDWQLQRLSLALA